MIVIWHSIKVLVKETPKIAIVYYGNNLIIGQNNLESANELVRMIFLRQIIGYHVYNAQTETRENHGHKRNVLFPM